MAELETINLEPTAVALNEHGTTLVELEHRDFERHGGAFADMRDKVNAEGGWAGLLTLFATRAEQTA